MTDCNRDPVTFSSLGCTSVVADFLGERLTSDAGALLSREIGERIGLFEALNQAIPDPQDPRLIIHDQKAMLAHRIIAIALGVECKNQSRVAATWPIRKLIGSERPQARSEPTHGRPDRDALPRPSNAK
jgi:hypothetical protein